VLSEPCPWKSLRCLFQRTAYQSNLYTQPLKGFVWNHKNSQLCKHSRSLSTVWFCNWFWENISSEKLTHCNLFYKWHYWKQSCKYSKQQTAYWLIDNPHTEDELQEIIMYAVLTISTQGLQKVFNNLFTRCEAYLRAGEVISNSCSKFPKSYYVI
jgi:hypothetical protein